MSISGSVARKPGQCSSVGVGAHPWRGRFSLFKAQHGCLHTCSHAGPHHMGLRFSPEVALESGHECCGCHHGLSIMENVGSSCQCYGSWSSWSPSQKRGTCEHDLMPQESSERNRGPNLWLPFLPGISLPSSAFSRPVDSQELLMGARVDC